jgi:hypothetical protein
MRQIYLLYRLLMILWCKINYYHCFLTQLFFEKLSTMKDVFPLPPPPPPPPPRCSHRRFENGQICIAKDFNKARVALSQQIKSKPC